MLNVFTFLLPGFVSAAIFYSLTSHPKPSAFDRVIQALIFTAVGQAIILFFLDDNPVDASQWSIWNFSLSVAVAVVLALIATWVSNSDVVHRLFRWLHITRETSYPSEWFSSFSRYDGCYVVLHLDGQRRLYGWPKEWPSSPDKGHFQITEGEWLDMEKRVPIIQVAAILIPVGAVEMVEFINQYNSIEPEEVANG